MEGGGLVGLRGRGRLRGGGGRSGTVLGVFSWDWARAKEEARVGSLGRLGWLLSRGRVPWNWVVRSVCCLRRVVRVERRALALLGVVSGVGEIEGVWR